MLKGFKPISLILIAGTFCFSGNAYADAGSVRQTTSIAQQSGKVTGTITDDFGPVIAASVVVKGTTNGTVTDMDGKFTLQGIKKGATIQVTYIGYTTYEVKYSGQPNIDIRLIEDSQALDEVVVTGYGGIQKTKTLTASAVIVKLESIAKLPVTSVSDGLGGRVTGIISQASSGAPGETTKIWIRGGSNILYVIDDVVMETAQGEVFFNRLRPDDIASMTVLKDASATAVYGPRANDGVVVVATKKGKSGSIDITYSQKFTLMTPSYRPETMSSWDYVNTKNELYAANLEENPAFNATEMSKYYMGHLNQQGVSRQDMLGMVNQKYDLGYNLQDINDLFNPYVTQGGNIEDYYQTYDPWEFFDHVQPMVQSNVSVRGGGDRVTYYSSLGYLSQSGISDSYGYDQYNALVTTEALLLDDKSLKFTLNLNGIMTEKKQPHGGDGIFNSTLVEGSEKPNVPRNWSTGLAKAGGLDSKLRTGFNDTDDYRLQANMGLKWSVPWVSGLSASANLNYNHSYSMNKSFKHPELGVYQNPYATKVNTYDPEAAEVKQSWSNYSLTTGIFQLDYNKSVGKHNFSAMLNYQSQIRNTNSTWASAKGYPSISVPQIAAGATQLGKGGDETKWGSSTYIGRFSYDYDSKYLLQLSGNYSGSLSYSEAKRWGVFYAVSGGWVLTEENFIKDNINTDIINMFKLRAGYGVVGKENSGPFDYMNKYRLNGKYNDDSGAIEEIYKILLGEGMSANSAWNEYHIASDLTWGESQQFSGGVDFSFLNDRLSGAFDTYLYMNRGDAMDMNQKLTYTPILGLPSDPEVNAPYITSKKGGIEFALNWNDRIGDFSYRVGVNYTHWDQVTTKHTEEETNHYYPGLNSLGQREEEETYKVQWVTDGLWGSQADMYNSFLHFQRNHTAGTFRMQDLNGDGVLNGGDQVWNGRAGSTPQTIYGINLGAGWKNFSLDVFLQGATDVTGNVPSPGRSQQGYFWNYGKLLYQNAYTPSNPNVDAGLQIPTNDSRGWGYNYVDAWVYDASYLKLKNISLSYDFKPTVLKNVKYIKGLQLNFIANNVFTWVKKNNPMKGMTDPEYLPKNSIWGEGKLGSYPTQRSYTFSAIVTL
jgi:TonB-linked SusC/RagA family outer membrane protein